MLITSAENSDKEVSYPFWS